MKNTQKQLVLCEIKNRTNSSQHHAVKPRDRKETISNGRPIYQIDSPFTSQPKGKNNNSRGQ